MATLERAAVCLTIGGSDSCGGAGIQADLRMFDRLGVRACSATTALTAQNPSTITHIEASSIAHLEAELAAVFDFFDVKVVKTGILVDAEHVHCVANLLQQRHPNRPLLIDPVMVASSGSRLLNQDALDVLQKQLLPQATLITPNLNEAAILLQDSNNHDPAEMAASLAFHYHSAILLKGGHGDGQSLHDFLCEATGEMHVFSHPAQLWNNDQAHGTGCRLAALIAALISKKKTIADACEQAIGILQGGSG